MQTPEHQPGRALVTGGAGFIGSHLVDHLLARGDRVTVIDNLSTGRLANLAQHEGNPSLTFVRADLTDALADFPHDQRFDQIYHLAAAVGVRRVLDRPAESIETNVLDTIALMRFALDRGPHAATPCPTLFASSSEVYGKSLDVPFREDADSVFGPTTSTRWSYGCSKALGEHLAFAHHHKHQLPVAVVRFFNTVGPRQVGDYGMVLPTFVDRVLAGLPPEVYGDGAQTRCFCDVRDIAPALPRVLENPECRGVAINLGSDRSVSVRQLAQIVIRTLGADLEPAAVPYDRGYGPGFEDLQHRQPDLTRARATIGFAPRIPLEQTILDLADERRRSAYADKPGSAGAC